MRKKPVGTAAIRLRRARRTAATAFIARRRSSVRDRRGSPNPQHFFSDVTGV
jgi:hypothetical protein